MEEFFAVVTRLGQITVPAEIRRSLTLKSGGCVGMSVGKIEEDRIGVTLRSVPSVARMTFGSVTPRKRPEDFDELRQVCEEGVAEEAVAETE
ncbi:MAG: AbrB/MazE/SpoVT family DNA-binding domain-containing protein [Chloroflexi bacterium]|nr:AbrB/MazE/SpoVT family DNA-binding domain-containing protein [Chloroflexota bacterium]